jgi:DNA-binding NtrC family response regulator
LQVALEPHGYALKFAANLEEGLAVLANHADELQLALVGGSILGEREEEGLRAFLNLSPQLIIVVMTGDLTTHHPDRLTRLGAARVLRKPFHVTELLQVLRDATDTVDRERSDTHCPAREEQGNG